MTNDMTDSLSDILDRVLGQEGGWVNDPADPGGATNHGVSLRYARRVGLDLDGDGDVDGMDIQMVSHAAAESLFASDFFYGPGISRLPEELWPVMVDSAVACGAPQAALFLQRSLMRYGLLPAITKRGLPNDDGVIGPRTIRAASVAHAEVSFETLVNTIVAQRCRFYSDVVTARPASARFLRGWLKRALTFLSP